MFHSKTKSYSLARTKSLPPESFLMGITGKKTSPRLEGYTWDKHGNGDYLDVTPRLFGTIPRSNTLSSKPKVTPKVRLLASAPSSPRSERRHPPEQSSPTVTPPSSRSTPWCKEEEEEGAVYTCYLKKVRYRSSQGSSQGEDEELSFKLWETVKIRLIKGGTLEKLIEHLTPPSQNVTEEDPGFFVTFLCTYRAFASAEQVLDLLIERRICTVLSVWLDQYPDDFDEPPYYTSLHKIITFAREDVEGNPGKDVCQKAEEKLRGLTVIPFDHTVPFKFKFCSCDTDTILECACDKSTVLKDKYGICLSSFSASLVAEQLTLVDAKLFRKVIPRQCLAAFWSKRDKVKGGQAPTIKATVNHFNAISRRVTSTILEATGEKSHLRDQQARVKILRCWIEIAQECRNIKNFSSLKAILSSLQSAAIHRLKKTWGLLPKETQLLYEELSEIFSDDSNQKTSRDLLMLPGRYTAKRTTAEQNGKFQKSNENINKNHFKKNNYKILMNIASGQFGHQFQSEASTGASDVEGTAKYATVDGRGSRKTWKKRQSWIKEGVVQGTVPYLGTFLTDLTMVDSAFDDKLKNGLINFEKRRKEFETIAQIKLLQEAAKNYNFEPDSVFQAWFYSLNTFSDNESYKLSRELEPRESVTPQPIRRQEFLRKHASVPDLLSKVLEEERAKRDKMSDRIYAFGTMLRRNISLKSTTSQSSADTSSSQDTPPESPATTPGSPHPPELPNNLLPVDKRALQPQGQIIKVTVEGSDLCHVYKGILLSSNDRTRDIIQKSLEKYDVEGAAEDYELHQVIPGSKELNIPFNTNVYYAVNKSTELKFKIARKKSLDKRR